MLHEHLDPKLTRLQRQQAIQAAWARAYGRAALKKNPEAFQAHEYYNIRAVEDFTMARCGRVRPGGYGPST